MKRTVFLTCAALAVAAWPALVSAQPVHDSSSPKAEFHLSHAFVVGGATLKPGDYKFQCRTIDGKHYLVVTSAQDGTELARVPCAPQTLQKKVAMSEILSVSRADGIHALTALRVRGEAIEHRIAAN